MKNWITTIKPHILLVIGSLIVGLALGWLFFHSGASAPSNEVNNASVEHEGPYSESQDPATWTCSMHPQIKQGKAGVCPICGMDLIPLIPMDTEAVGHPNELQMSDAAMQLAAIQTMVVETGKPTRSIHLQGKIEVDEGRISEITAHFGGRIEQLFVKFTGQRVRKGEKLATIYSPELVTAQRELLESIALRDTRPALYGAARNKLKLWNLTDDQIQSIEQKGEAVLYFDILASTSGTVIQRHVVQGDYVETGSALFQLADLSYVWAQFDAYESDLPWIRINDSVEFGIQSIPGKRYRGKVAFVDPLLDAKSRVAKVRVQVKNHNREIKPEMFIKGQLQSQFAAKGAVVLIPKSALLWTGKRAVVYVYLPQRATPTFRYREVVLGADAGQYYVVSEGLEAGEEIAVNGVFKIDAAAQLQGLPSMMNPAGDAMVSGHHFEGDSNLLAPDEHNSFKVGGNCEMCKERIENAALSVSGVSSALWNSETKELQLTYSKGVSITKIHKAIVKVGHDTEKEHAKDVVYNELPGCCLYDRLEKNEDHTLNLDHSMFKVRGLCGMCKDRIEGAALAVEGVESAHWESETEILHIDYDATKTAVKTIQIAVAAVGHDTEKYRAPDTVYQALPGCCKYLRIK